jgi:phosphomannomutase/phosphoglucomutase
LFFQDRWYGFDDALYAAARLLEILSQTLQSSAQVFAKFPELSSTPELSIPVSEQQKFIVMDALMQQARFSTPHEILAIDGLRVEFADGWGLVRPSNTTAKLVARFEAVDNITLQAIQQQFRTALLQVAPELVVPF